MSYHAARPTALPSTSRRIRGLALALVAAAACLVPAACDRAETPPAASPVEPMDVLVGPSGHLPELGVQRLTSLPVFPTASGPLEVVATEPSDGAEDTAVAADAARIVVRFNHPVVPLAAPGEATADEGGEQAARWIGRVAAAQSMSPIEIEPAVAGEGRWIDTSTYVLEPSEDLRPATRYAVTVPAGLADQMGAQLDADHVFAFETEGPRVVAVGPDRGERYVAPTRAISVVWNVAIEPEAARTSFELRRANLGEPLAGRIEVDGAVLTFTPDEPFEKGVRYQARVAGALPTADGGHVTGDELVWSFETAPPIEVQRVSPADGAEGVDLRWEGVEIAFSTPMKTSSLTVTLEPTITNQSIWWDEAGRTAHVTGGFLASTEYAVTVEKALGRHGDSLAAPFAFGFDTGPIEPTVRFNSTDRFGVHVHGRPQVLWMTAINTDEQSFGLSAMPVDDLASTVLDYQRFEEYRPSPPAGAAISRTWSVDTRSELDVPYTVSTTLAADGASLPTGVYLLTAAGQPQSKRVLLVSEANVTLKVGRDEALVWVTDLATGADVAGAEVTIFDAASEEDPSPVVVATGTTDADGLWQGAVERTGQPWQPLVVVVSRAGRFAGATATEWLTGIEPWSFDLPFDTYPTRYAAGVYTDRPVYRPGQRVYFRGVVRADDDAAYSLPTGATLQLTIRDPNYEPLYVADLPLDAYGTFDGQFPLSAGAPLGDFQIEAALFGADVAQVEFDARPAPDYSFSQSFRVAAYRKPDFEVSVTIEEPEYVDGDTLRATVEAAYAFGGPVADAPVRWRLLRDDFFFDSPLGGDWRFMDYDLVEANFYTPEAAVIAEGEGVTDDEGRMVVEVPAELSDVPLSQVFTLDADVTDINHQVVAQRDSAVVHKADFYVGVRPEHSVARAGQAETVEVAVVDPRGEPVAQRQVAIELYSRTWYSIRERREDGGFYWTSHFTDTLVSERQVTTDDQGRASTSVVAEDAGVHRIVATAVDDARREATSAAYVWVTADRGFVNWRQENTDRIDLVADKREYAPGETAQVLIPAPFEGAEALVTLERGRVRDVRRLRLEGNDETIEIPITADLAPNVYVSVVLVKGIDEQHRTPQLKLGYANLPIRLDEQTLTLTITPDREPAVYAPRETVRWAIDVADFEGDPVQAELSLALVDRTLLALVEDTSRSLSDVFWGQRPLGVSTSASLTRSIDRLNEQLEADRKGGGGGIAPAGGTIRRLFEDTAYWNPGLVTDSQGRATFETPLPDNLTTWRLDARAIAVAGARVGDAEAEVVASLPILLRPVLPRFAVIGDQAQIEAIVQNGTQGEAELEVSLDALGLEILDTPAKALTIPAGGKGKVIWNTRVSGGGLSTSQTPGAAGDITLGMRVVDASTTSGGQVGEALDAVELRVPAYRFTQPVVLATAGEVADSVTEQLALPADAVPDSAALRVTLNPSLSGESLAQVEALQVFPYLCSEQTVSRFLPNIAAYEAAVALGDAGAAQREALEPEVQAGVQRLYGMQNADGGWGWWSGGESRAFLSAYALLGLSRARGAGFTVPEAMLSNATAYLYAVLDSRADPDGALDAADDGDSGSGTDGPGGERFGLDRRAFTTWVLAEHGEDVGARAIRLWEERDGLSASGSAFLAMALATAGDEQAERVAGILARLSAAAALGPDGAQFEPERRDPIAMDSATRATAIAVMALSRLQPDSPILDDAVRWLLVASSVGGDGHGVGLTTQEQAWTVLALSEHLRSSGQAEGSAQYEVDLNGVPLGVGAMSDATDRAEVAVATSEEGLSAGTTNALTIRRQGDGQLFYTARMEYAVDASGVMPADEGIAIGRRYRQVDPSRFTPLGEPVDEARVGDVLQVELTLVTDRTLSYVMIEDPLPAGFEAVDTSLRTTSAAAASPEMVQDESESAMTERPWWDDGGRVWSQTELRDEKVAVFAEQLEPGTYRFTYLVRASLAGDFLVMPAQASEMYFPTTRGNSAGGVFRILRPEGEVVDD